MSQSRCFSVIGDSNVHRHFSLVNARACPLVKAPQLLTCGRLQVFPESIRQVRNETTVCIVSCLTNFLTSTDGASSVSLRVEPVLTSVRDQLLEAASSGRVFLICPPMYRVSPLWYREGLPEILQKFSDVLNGFDNLRLMPSFPTPQFEDDGVHLTAYSGLEFVLHLFDSATNLLDSLDTPLEEKTSVSAEASRRLEDRMMAIEQDHRRLNKSFEFKTAIDAELADWHENRRLEDSFVIQGLPRLSGTDLSPKDWQVRARRDVLDFIKKLLGRELPVVFVSNATGRARDAVVRYVVRMSSIADSEEIRTKFSYFFKGSVDARPPHFKVPDISVRNALTKNTRVRLDVLHLFGQRYKDSNQGAKYKVIGFRSRPLLKLIPPPNSDDRRIKSFTYIEAVRKLPANFTSEQYDPIIKKIDSDFHGRIRAIFVVLTDDMLKKKFGRRDPARSGAASGSNAEAVEQEASSSDEQEPEAAAETVAEPEAGGSATGARSPARDSNRGSRTNKRGPPSPCKTVSKSKQKK